MRSRLAVLLLLSVGMVFGLLFWRQAYRSRDLPLGDMQAKKLHLLTYSTFMSTSGPGREFIKQFESQCGCEVEVTTANDAGILLERLKLAEQSVPFDVVIGIDQMSLVKAREQSTWKPVVVEADFQDEVADTGGEFFVPFDWSPMGFIYRVSEGPVPKSFAELTDPKYKGQFGLQDPRASSPGLQFVQWVRALKGDKAADFFAAFKPNVQSVSPSWQFSYGLFEKKQVRFVFSYVTSLAYHWGIQKDRDFQFLSFLEGHPAQIEYAGIPATCRECTLAADFLKTLLEPRAQMLIMEKNFMFPAIEGLEPETIFAELPRPEVISTPTGKDLSDWDKAFQP